MQRPRPHIAYAIVLALLFVRLTGVHYLLCLDAQEPTTDIVAKMYLVGWNMGGDTCPDDDSPADTNIDLTTGDSLAKIVLADAGFALLTIAIVLFALVSRPQRLAPPGRADRLRYTGPPHFFRPPLRAPPL